eukprot:m.43229 g.43229  ORF g.43229 m.43229 type:complete len:406 (+) comp19323_c1_seq1:459-1676(+)
MSDPNANVNTPLVGQPAVNPKQTPPPPSPPSPGTQPTGKCCQRLPDAKTIWFAVQIVIITLIHVTTITISVVWISLAHHPSNTFLVLNSIGTILNFNIGPIASFILLLQIKCGRTADERNDVERLTLKTFLSSFSEYIAFLSTSSTPYKTTKQRLNTIALVVFILIAIGFGVLWHFHFGEENYGQHHQALHYLMLLPMVISWCVWSICFVWSWSLQTREIENVCSADTDFQKYSESVLAANTGLKNMWKDTYLVVISIIVIHVLDVGVFTLAYYTKSFTPPMSLLDFSFGLSWDFFGVWLTILPVRWQMYKIRCIINTQRSHLRKTLQEQLNDTKASKTASEDDINGYIRQCSDRCIILDADQKNNQRENCWAHSHGCQYVLRDWSAVHNEFVYFGQSCGLRHQL